ncbi:MULTISPECIES: DUF4124 domain-containing protein [Marinobacter]|uniref:DUF4124 domain-containing protein n=1 Tax=Marinobacter suaedae TaxID=3057675 RepID=A0ABT8W0B7_9GAMM|nr:MULTISPECIES: DUF4124 domain-containing protein [unclassified Marinobacter]MBZ2170295.1 DUF4124 domain-containing protein [Marinobacter sp. F4216]MDO3721693.1 DUF4124 domain-containing protein [Marinobacter sp. chi1]
MITKWLLRLSFPALGLLMLLIFFGLEAPEQVTEPVAEEKQTDIPAFEGLVPTPVSIDGPDIIFKWRDNNGHWHFADQPPENDPWNSLAIERVSDSGTAAAPETDWQAPYHAPFAMSPTPGSNGS